MRFGKVVNEITICGCIRVPSWWSFKKNNRHWKFGGRGVRKS